MVRKLALIKLVSSVLLGTAAEAAIVEIAYVGSKQKA